MGPLYRVGSNMLSIRQLQCLPGVNLSYALVNAVGVSEFSEPQEQCFYGEWGGRARRCVRRVPNANMQIQTMSPSQHVSRYVCIIL